LRYFNNIGKNKITPNEKAFDDYEICFSLPPQHRTEIDAWNQQQPDCPLSIVGEMTGSGFILQVDDDVVDLAPQGGFRHFD
jgi:thiamine monophosphate kinase